MGKKKLTTWEAACIITGYGLGAGVLSMPYMAEKNGLPAAMIILLIAYIASYVLHLMIADLAIKCGEDAQILTCLTRFLFRGKLKNVLKIVFFVLMAGILTFNLATYITGAEEVLISMLPISSVAAKLAFYAVAAVVVLFGLKAVGISEKYTVMLIFILVGVLAVASLFHLEHMPAMRPGSGRDALAYFGVAMFAMSAFFSVPQAVDGLGGDVKEVKKSVFLGLLNNLILIVVITVCAMAASGEVTEVAMVGWSKGIGLWASVIGSIFTVLAMLTTYWSLSLALGGLLNDMLKVDYRLCWLFATLPSIIIAMIRFSGFIELMRTAGGLIAIVVAFMVVPAYSNARNEVEGTILKRGGLTVQLLIIAAYLLMAVGSVV